MKIYIGVDIGDNSFLASALSTPTEVMFKYEPYENSDDGFTRFYERLLSVNITTGDIILEATGVYCEAFCHYFYHVGYRVCVEAPIIVKRAFRKKPKTDPLDSLMLAEYGFRFLDQLHVWTPRNDIVDRTAVLLSLRESLVKQLTLNKNATHTLKRRKRHDDLLPYYDDLIIYLKAQIKDIDNEIADTLRRDVHIYQIFKNLVSVPGVGKLLAANIMLLTEGFTIVNYRHLASRLGLAPHEFSSGTSVKRKDRSEGFGHLRTRKLLYLASVSLTRSNMSHHTLHQYYHRKKAEGKDGRLVINNLSNKLLKIMCAIIKSGKPYIAGHTSVNPHLFEKIAS